PDPRLGPGVGRGSRCRGARSGGARPRGQRTPGAPVDGARPQAAPSPLHGRGPDDPGRQDPRRPRLVPDRRSLAAGGAAPRHPEEPGGPAEAGGPADEWWSAARGRQKVDPMSPDDLKLLPSPDVVSRRVAGEYLLVPVRSGAAQMNFIFTANEVG